MQLVAESSTPGADLKRKFVIEGEFCWLKTDLFEFHSDIVNVAGCTIQLLICVTYWVHPHTATRWMLLHLIP